MHILPTLLILEQFLIILASNIILVKFLLQKLHWSLANIVTRENPADGYADHGRILAPYHGACSWLAPSSQRFRSSSEFTSVLNRRDGLCRRSATSRLSGRSVAFGQTKSRPRETCTTHIPSFARKSSLLRRPALPRTPTSSRGSPNCLRSRASVKRLELS
jgi:hypothetical protein